MKMKFLLNIYKKRRFVANKLQLLSIASNQLDLFGKKISEKNFFSDYNFNASKELLLKELSEYISSQYDQIAVLDDKINNYTEIATAFVSTVAFEFFEYHRFAIGAKYFSDRYCKPYIYYFHFLAIQWGHEHGFVTDEELEEDRLAFIEA